MTAQYLAGRRPPRKAAACRNGCCAVHRLRVQEPPRRGRGLHARAALLPPAGGGAERAQRPAHHAAPDRGGRRPDLVSGPTCRRAGTTVRVGFAADRVSVQPSLALLLIVLGVGAVVTVITAAVMARWLITPLARLVSRHPAASARAGGRRRCRRPGRPNWPCWRASSTAWARRSRNCWPIAPPCWPASRTTCARRWRASASRWA